MTAITFSSTSFSPSTGFAPANRTDRARRSTPARPSPAVYRRRRVAALVLFLLVIVSVTAGGSLALRALGSGPLTATGATSAATGEGVRIAVQPVARSIYVVRSGDTVWTIARTLQPEGDVRPLVDRLMAERGGRPLRAGEEIVLP